MADTLFDYAADKLAQRSLSERLAARGTLRLSLKTAGLDPASVTPAQLRVVIEKLLPNELEMRGVSDVAAVCRRLIQDIENAPTALQESEPGVDDIFRRLANDR